MEIDAYVAGLDEEDYLFPSKKTDKPITRIQASRILNDTAAKVGLDEIGTHTHWFTRNQAKLDAENLAKSIRRRTKGLPVTPIIKTKIEEVIVNENELDRLREEGKIKEG
nr:hypothetical protein [Aneurinibacillus tyrosinisolvens]